MHFDLCQTDSSKLGIIFSRFRLAAFERVIKREMQVTSCSSRSTEVGDAAPGFATRAAQSSSREARLDLQEAEGLRLSCLVLGLEPAEPANRAFNGKAAWAALLFLRLLAWVSGSQGDH